MKPSLSIIVLTCNQKDFTISLLQSLKPWLKENPESELIIVDNGSADDTLNAVRTEMEPLTGQLQYLYNDRNLGVAGGRNKGLRKARKDYILILDNDTVVTSEAIDALRDYLHANPQCGLCAPALISPEGKVQSSAKPFPGILIKLRHVIGGILPALFRGDSAAEKASMKAVNPFYVIGACQMFRREIIDRIGLLDANIFYGPEDADWCMRIAATGQSINYLPSIKIIHHWQRATTRSPFSKLSLIHAKALLYFYKKHHRWLR